MKTKVKLAISTLVLCGSVATAEASKHHAISSHSKHTATTHTANHHASLASKSHSKHPHSTHYALAHHRHRFHEASGDLHLGTASLYSERFQGKRTASGEPYDMFALTAAHRTLPLRSYVEVTNLRNNRTVVVRINDRGPFHGNRVIDLSSAAAEELGIQGGSGQIKITPLAMN
jgi:rare lipoprotein A